jgi:hypothetical protein
MILTNTQFGYEYWLIENGADCDIIAQSAPASIGILAFDTETDTKIDMSNNDGSSIDIVHDRPFMIQFGWGSKIYIADLRGHDDAFKDRVLATFRLCAERAKLAIAHNIRFDINMLINIGFDWNLRNGCDSISPIVPPISVITTSAPVSCAVRYTNSLISFVICGITCTVEPKYSPLRSLFNTFQYTFPDVRLEYLFRSSSIKRS